KRYQPLRLLKGPTLVIGNRNERSTREVADQISQAGQIQPPMHGGKNGTPSRLSNGRCSQSMWASRQIVSPAARLFPEGPPSQQQGPTWVCRDVAREARPAAICPACQNRRSRTASPRVRVPPTLRSATQPLARVPP